MKTVEHDSNLIVNCQEEAYGNYGDEKNLIEFRKEMIQRIKFVSFHKEEAMHLHLETKRHFCLIILMI